MNSMDGRFIQTILSVILATAVLRVDAAFVREQLEPVVKDLARNQELI